MPLKTRKSASLRIAIGGLAVTYPFGGMFWHYMQFVYGLKQLGHEVLYIEDLERWCYSPHQQTFVESGAANAANFERHLKRLDPELANSWTFRDVTGAVYGKSRAEAQEFCRGADIFLNISMSHDVLEVYPGAQCVVLVDTDPIYTQALLAPDPGSSADPERASEHARVLRMMAGHDVFFTYGLNVGADDCLVPTGGYQWHHLVQPVVLDCFAASRRKPDERRAVFTTIASWEPHEALTRVGGMPYGGKSREFEHILGLPRQVSTPLEIALSGDPPIERLRENNWRLVDGFSASADPWRYQAYLADSMGEFSVAKHAYVASRSGWFSDRSACYLALDVPVVLQDTAFSRVLPTGEGLFSYSEMDEAAAAIEAVAAAPDKHAAAARDIAHTYFRADHVMSQLVDTAGAYV